MQPVQPLKIRRQSVKRATIASKSERPEDSRRYRSHISDKTMNFEGPGDDGFPSPREQFPPIDLSSLGSVQHKLRNDFLYEDDNRDQVVEMSDFDLSLYYCNSPTKASSGSCYAKRF